MSEVERKYENIQIKEIGPKIKGKNCRITGRIVNVGKPQTLRAKVQRECENCGTTFYEYFNENWPDRTDCLICWSKCAVTVGFPEFEYYEIQHILIEDSSTARKVSVRLTGSQVDYDKYKVGQEVQIEGMAYLKKSKNGKYEYKFSCDEISILEDSSNDDIEDDDALRETPEYRKWVDSCKQRDNNKCQICGGYKHLEVHHIYSYKDHPEIRLDEGNGITLCTFCHQKFHSYYGKKVTPSDLVRFIFELG